jgi:hypothetical protein
MTDRATFRQAVADAVAAFPDNALCRRLDAGVITRADYHALLRTLFHQTFEGPATFALAGFHCDPRHVEARAYLMHHAEEEKEHWRWVINDLRASGDEGPDPRETFPGPATQAYVAFNVYTAVRAPVARLGIAAVLEGIGGRWGGEYGGRLCRSLGLGREQASFFLSHGELDKGHVEEVFGVIDRADLGPQDWAWLAHAARTAGALYRGMYDAAGDVTRRGEGAPAAG